MIKLYHCSDLVRGAVGAKTPFTDAGELVPASVTGIASPLYKVILTT